MRYSPEKVRDILSQKKDRERAEKVFDTPDEEIRFLDRCLKVLDECDRDILEKIFFEKVSVRSYAKISGFSRNFINNRRDRSIELLAKFFNLKFE